jgi:hypothetical protein
VSKIDVQSFSACVLVAMMFATGCSTISPNGAGNARNQSVLTAPAPKPTNLNQENLQPDELAVLQKYAEAYEPKSGREVIPSPPSPDSQISKILTKAGRSNSRDHEKFIVLIILRLSRFQIENFKKTYELGRENPMAREFYRLIGHIDFERAERMPASLADDYVEKNPQLLTYEPIMSEMRRIDAAASKIKKSSL